MFTVSGTHQTVLPIDVDDGGPRDRQLRRDVLRCPLRLETGPTLLTQPMIRSCRLSRSSPTTPTRNNLIFRKETEGPRSHVSSHVHQGPHRYRRHETLVAVALRSPPGSCRERPWQQLVMNEVPAASTGAAPPSHLLRDCPSGVLTPPTRRDKAPRSGGTRHRRRVRRPRTDTLRGGRARRPLRMRLSYEPPRLRATRYRTPLTHHVHPSRQPRPATWSDTEARRRQQL